MFRRVKKDQMDLTWVISALTRERQMYMYNTGIILKSNEVTKNLSIRSCRSLNLINEIMVKFQARINDLEARNLIWLQKF